jgi:hypothetical protein
MIIEKTKPEQIVFTPDSSSGRPGTWFLGRFLYWEKDLKWSLIKLENSKKRLEKILEFFTWLIIFAGWLAFALWILRNQAVLLDNPIRIFFFWAKKDPLIFCFLLFS